jgi:hypothetical protein
MAKATGKDEPRRVPREEGAAPHGALQGRRSRAAGREEPCAAGREEPRHGAAATHGGGGRAPGRRRQEGQRGGGVVDGSTLGSIGVDRGPNLSNLFTFGSTRSEPDAQIRSGSCLRTG